MQHQIADLHCHYPMHLLAEEDGGDPFVRPLRKIKKRRLWNKIRAILVRWAAQRLNFGKKEEWLVNLEELDRGGVRLVFSVLYVPETELGIEEWLSGHPEEHSFKELTDHLEEVNEDLTRERDGGPAHVIVNHASQLEGAGRDDTIRFVHCVEGGAHLGADPEEIDGRIKALADQGVGYITLAHLFWRHVATNAPALPNLSDGQYDFVFSQPDEVGLSALGEAAVRAMYRHGVLIDISHMRQRAIDETFALLAELDDREGNDPTAYPVLATHAGYRFGEHSYMLSADTVRAVAARDGVVGLIMAHHLLNDGLHEDDPGDLATTLRSVRFHIGKLHELTGSYRHIGLGSDLDGFIKPMVGGIEMARDLAPLAEALHGDYPEHAEAMLFGNALRALEAAYRRRPT
ncbi:MAG TPA: membrane dipeptidase [Solirubrobacterales bacterium]|nr:membrane dipeptidase [Solirubrobacterales bacterium]